VILVVDMNWKRSSLGAFEFVQPIVSAIGELDECTVKHYQDVMQQDLTQFDAAILSGTPLKDNTTLNQLDKFNWLKTWNKPVLGICAGFQTIGLVFGARLKRCLGIGMAEISTLQTNVLFSSRFSAYTLHNFSIESGDAFDLIAESAQCIQAIKHKQRDVYGVLFHPEVRNPDILKRFVSEFSRHRRV
jgi:GMP synthase-like glutamine amidotransferase